MIWTVLVYLVINMGHKWSRAEKTEKIKINFYKNIVLSRKTTNFSHQGKIRNNINFTPNKFADEHSIFSLETFITCLEDL